LFWQQADQTIKQANKTRQNSNFLGGIDNIKRKDLLRTEIITINYCRSILFQQLHCWYLSSFRVCAFVNVKLSHNGLFTQLEPGGRPLPVSTIEISSEDAPLLMYMYVHVVAYMRVNNFVWCTCYVINVDFQQTYTVISKTSLYILSDDAPNIDCNLWWFLFNCSCNWNACYNELVVFFSNGPGYHKSDCLCKWEYHVTWYEITVVDYTIYNVLFFLNFVLE